MLKFFGLACTNKKDKNKLALTAGPSESTSSTIQITRGPSLDVGIDESLNQSVAIPQPTQLNTSHFMTNVISDVSFDAAAFQNRATPIDFGTREVKADEDVLSVAGRRRSVNTITPSPIPEEPEDNLTENLNSPSKNIPENGIFEPRNRFHTPRLKKVRKQARVYNSNDSTASASSSFSSSQDDSHRIDSIRVRASKSVTNNLLKGRLTPPVMGGSLRPVRAKRHSIAFDGNNTLAALDRRRSDFDKSHLERCEFWIVQLRALFKRLHDVCLINK